VVSGPIENRAEEFALFVAKGVVDSYGVGNRYDIANELVELEATGACEPEHLVQVVLVEVTGEVAFEPALGGAIEGHDSFESPGYEDQARRARQQSRLGSAADDLVEYVATGALEADGERAELRELRPCRFVRVVEGNIGTDLPREGETIVMAIDYDDFGSEEMTRLHSEEADEARAEYEDAIVHGDSGKARVVH
jgi:hypothetical protein